MERRHPALQDHLQIRSAMDQLRAAPDVPKEGAASTWAGIRIGAPRRRFRVAADPPLTIWLSAKPA
jgi:hypothetical protein